MHKRNVKGVANLSIMNVKKGASSSKRSALMGTKFQEVKGAGGGKRNHGKKKIPALNLSEDISMVSVPTDLTVSTLTPSLTLDTTRLDSSEDDDELRMGGRRKGILKGNTGRHHHPDARETKSGVDQSSTREVVNELKLLLDEVPKKRISLQELTSQFNDYKMNSLKKICQLESDLKIKKTEMDMTSQKYSMAQEEIRILKSENCSLKNETKNVAEKKSDVENHLMNVREEYADKYRRLEEKYQQMFLELNQKKQDEHDKLSDTKISLAITGSELQTLQAVSRTTECKLLQTELERDELKLKVETLNEQTGRLKTDLVEKMTRLSLELHEKSAKLEYYEQLENDLDKLVVKTAQVSESANVKNVLDFLGSATLPTDSRRRLKQAFELAQEVASLKKLTVEQKDEIFKLRDEREVHRHEIEAYKTAYGMSNYPTSKLITTISEKSMEIGKATRQIKALEQQLRGEKEQYNMLKHEFESLYKGLLDAHNSATSNTNAKGASNACKASSDDSIESTMPKPRRTMFLKKPLSSIPHPMSSSNRKPASVESAEAPTARHVDRQEYLDSPSSACAEVPMPTAHHVDSQEDCLGSPSSASSSEPESHSSDVLFVIPSDFALSDEDDTEIITQYKNKSFKQQPSSDTMSYTDSLFSNNTQGSDKVQAHRVTEKRLRPPGLTISAPGCAKVQQQTSALTFSKVKENNSTHVRALKF